MEKFQKIYQMNVLIFDTFKMSKRQISQPLFTLKINKHTYKKRYHNTPEYKI